MSFLNSNTVDAAPATAIKPPSFVAKPHDKPPASLQKIIDDWKMIKHREGGYFKETDRSPFTMDICDDFTKASATCQENKDSHKLQRNFSTLIYYLVTPDSPIGKLHKNKNRIIHILQKGRGQYVLIYPDGKVKSFKVGFDYKNGEISQWVVPGGVYKASFILENEEFDNGLLISEVVVPGFEYTDHNFMSGTEELEALVGKKEASKLSFLL